MSNASLSHEKDNGVGKHNQTITSITSEVESAALILPFSYTNWHKQDLDTELA